MFMSDSDRSDCCSAFLSYDIVVIRPVIKFLLVEVIA